MKGFKVLFVAVVIIMLMGCSTGGPQKNSDTLNVLASSTIIGDVVRQIGGDRISLAVLYPIGADPHTFEARPQDIIAITNADIIFLNGFEYEHTIESIIEANAKGLVVEVSDGIVPLPFEESHEDFGSTEEGHDHAAGDPHVWMDLNNVQI